MSQTLYAQDIINLLEEPTDDRRLVMNRLTAEAPLAELLAAFQEKPAPLTCQLLCDLLGKRSADPEIDAALPLLVEALQDPSPGVRGSAVEALTNIGIPSTGDALMAAYNREELDEGMRRLFLAAFGAVGFRPALPFLLQGLHDPDGTTRQCAAWGLGKLRDPEAQEALLHALQQETDRYAAEVMREALKAFRPSNDSQNPIPSYREHEVVRLRNDLPRTHQKPWTGIPSENLFAGDRGTIVQVSTAASGQIAYEVEFVAQDGTARAIVEVGVDDIERSRYGYRIEHVQVGLKQLPVMRLPQEIGLVTAFLFNDVQRSMAGYYLSALDRVLEDKVASWEAAGNVCRLEIRKAFTWIIDTLSDDENECLIETPELRELITIWSKLIESEV
jgi:Domain of unknown function (DUF4926)/HEAT repeats/PBS lyase HEAT-like repeat